MGREGRGRVRREMASSGEERKGKEKKEGKAKKGLVIREGRQGRREG